MKQALCLFLLTVATPVSAQNIKYNPPVVGRGPQIAYPKNTNYGTTNGTYYNYGTANTTLYNRGTANTTVYNRGTTNTTIHNYGTSRITIYNHNGARSYITQSPR